MGLRSPLRGRDVLSLLLTVRLQPVPARGKRGRLRRAEPCWYLTEFPVCGCQPRAGPAEPFRNLRAVRRERVFILVNWNHVLTQAKSEIPAPRCFPLCPRRQRGRGGGQHPPTPLAVRVPPRISPQRSGGSLELERESCCSQLRGDNGRHLRLH